MGCPTSYGGRTATWSKGRLSKLSSGSLQQGMENFTYSYNAYGQRVSKSYSHMEGSSGANPIPNGELIAYSKQFYYDHAGRLLAETASKTLKGQSATSENIVFLYDEGTIIGMEHTVGGTTSSYYFHRSPMGDVVGIYNTSGTLVAKYLYDAWGNCTIASGTTNYTVANANPIRYRGYYYDDDTGLYYCNARYYSPKWRRFISPDDTTYLDPESVNGLNLYCYCNNDPITLMKSSNPAAGATTVYTTFTVPSTAITNLHPGVINNPEIPGWIQDAIGAYSDIKLGIRYFYSKGMHAKFAYATKTRFMFPQMGGTWRWFKRGSSRLANYSVITSGSFKQILTGNARAGFRAIAQSVGRMAGVNFGLNLAFNFYENDFQFSWDMLGDTVIDTAIGTASTLIAAGAMSFITAGAVATGLSMPGIVVVGGVILLSIGIEYVIREIFDYPD